MESNNYYNKNILKRKSENGETSNGKIKRKTDEVLDELNAIQPKKVLSIKEMLQNVEYKIVSAKKVKTKYGEQIMVEHVDTVTFLPKRYHSLSEKAINALNEGKYSMKIMEMSGRTYNIEFSLSTNDDDAFPNVDDDDVDELFIAATQDLASYYSRNNKIVK